MEQPENTNQLLGKVNIPKKEEQKAIVLDDVKVNYKKSPPLTPDHSPSVVLTYTVERRRYIRTLEGKVMQKLRKDHNVFIELRKKNVYISGKKCDCEDALNAIRSIIAKRKEREAENKESVRRLGQLIS